MTLSLRSSGAKLMVIVFAFGACAYVTYRIGTQAIDGELDLSARQSAVVRIGGATGEPPIASASLDRLSGPVPLKVNIDMSASTDELTLKSRKPP